MIIGIDPGKSGAVAILNSNGTLFDQLIGIESAVSLYQFIAGRNGALLNCGELDAFAYVEKARAMPKNGAVSMFNYGRGFGEIIGVLTTLEIPYELVTPNIWTRTMFVGVSTYLEGKARARDAVERLFPGVNLLASDRCKKPHEGLVDALLIAEWGRRKRTGK